MLCVQELFISLCTCTPTSCFGIVLCLIWDKIKKDYILTFSTLNFSITSCSTFLLLNKLRTYTYKRGKLCQSCEHFSMNYSRLEWRLSNKKYRMIYYLSLYKKTLKQNNKTGQPSPMCCVHMCEFSRYETTSVLNTKGLILLFAQNVKNNVGSRCRMVRGTWERNVDSLFSQLGSIHLKSCSSNPF